MGFLTEGLKSHTLTIEDISNHLDSLDHSTRIEEVRSLGPSAQKSLWTLTAGTQLTLEDFVPTSVADLEPVIHYGRNTLPVFKMFEKRFCRAPEGTDTQGLWGYNEGSTRSFVGPGYFVCRSTGGDERGSIVIDYTLIPAGKSSDWPNITPNERGVSRFVYAGMEDFMRRVSQHVTIGRAYRYGKASNNYFMLCRER